MDPDTKVDNKQATEDANLSRESEKEEKSQSLVEVAPATDLAGYSSGRLKSDFLTDEVIALSTDDQTKWSDLQRQSGPSPADFGDHQPIPLDAVCASVVLTDGKDLEGDFSEETEESLDQVLRRGGYVE